MEAVDSGKYIYRIHNIVLPQFSQVFFFFFFITGYQIWYPPSSAPIRILGVMPDFSFPRYSKVWCLYLLTFSLEGGEGLCAV